jgi:Spermidine/putrescine-binding periplasmic protein
MTKRHTLFVLLSILLIIVLLPSCSKKQKEELIIYGWEGLFPEEVLTAFEKETGISIVYSSFDSNETMLERLTTSKGSGYDLVIGDDYIIEEVIRRNLAAPLDFSKLSNKGNINPLYQGYFYDTESKYTIPFGAGIPLIVYDRAATGFEITGYSDLWDSRLKDSVAITANYRLINGITLKTMGKSLNEEDLAVIAKAGEKLLELAPNIRLVQDDNTQVALLNGEAKAAFLYTSQVTAALAEDPSLSVCYPREGLGIGIMNFFIPSKASNKDAAHNFLNYLLRPETGAKCFNYLGYYSTFSGSDSLTDPNLVVKGAFEGEIMENVSAEADEAYLKNWLEFKTALN